VKITNVTASHLGRPVSDRIPLAPRSLPEPRGGPSTTATGHSSSIRSEGDTPICRGTPPAFQPEDDDQAVATVAEIREATVWKSSSMHTVDSTGQRVCGWRTSSVPIASAGSKSRCRPKNCDALRSSATDPAFRVRRRATLHAVAVPTRVGAEVGRVHHAGHQSHWRHLRNQADRKHGVGLLRTDQSTRCNTPSDLVQGYMNVSDRPGLGHELRLHGPCLPVTRACTEGCGRSWIIDRSRNTDEGLPDYGEARRDR
jgi:hypothetical protein